MAVNVNQHTKAQLSSPSSVSLPTQFPSQSMLYQTFSFLSLLAALSDRGQWRNGLICTRISIWYYYTTEAKSLRRHGLREKINKLTRTQRSRNTSHKNGLSGVQWLRTIHHKITVIQVPGPDLDLKWKQGNVWAKPKKVPVFWIFFFLFRQKIVILQLNKL